MSANVIFNPTHKTLPVSNLFATRQPVLDRQQNLVAYGMLFRNASLDPQNVVSDLSETALVMGHFVALGIEKILGDAHAFISIDDEVLMGDIVTSLPSEKIILEIVGSTSTTPAVLARIEELAKLGFRFSLNNITSDLIQDGQRFLPYVDIVRFDLNETPTDALPDVLAQFNLEGKKLLADKVDTVAQFNACLALGFDYFEGFFFTRPVIVTGKKLSPSQVAVMRLMGMITTDADSSAIELGLKKDVTLGLNLLRLVNSPSVGSHRIDSLKQALMVLGRNQLQRWLQIMLYAEPNKNGQNLKPLLMLATTRGKLMELMAHKHKPGNSSIGDTAFLVGIMSLMDTLFGLPMQDVLKETAVVEEVYDALMLRKGYFGDLLKLAENAEKIQDVGILLTSIKNLQLTSEEFYMLQLLAFEWSDAISHVMP